MKKNNLLQIITAALMVFSFAASFSITAFAETATNEGIVVCVRIDNGTENILLRTTVILSPGSSAVDALAAAAGDEVEFIETGSGKMLFSLFGLAAENNSEWMLAANNEVMLVDCEEYVLSGGEELVWFYTDPSAAVYSYFTKSAVEADANETVALTLVTGASSADGSIVISPVADAQIIVYDSFGYAAAIETFTDIEGKVSLVFDAPGKYTVTAAKKNESGQNLISYPYCEVYYGLTDGEENEQSGSDTFTVPVFADIEAGEIYLYNRLVKTDLRPYMANSEVMLPFRAIAEALGANVGWEPEGSVVTAVLGDIFVRFTFADSFYGVPVAVIEGRTFLPARYFIEQFHLEPAAGFPGLNGRR